MKIGLCENDIIITENLIKIIRKLEKTVHDKFWIEEFSKMEEVCKYLQSGNKLDIIILEVTMQTADGLEIAKFIRNQINDQLMQIIFLSAKESYAMEVFSVRPFDFLVSPFTDEKISDVIQKAVEHIETNSQAFVYEKNGGLFRVPYKKIIYFESFRRKIQIVTVDREESFYGKISDLENQLDSDSFIAINRSIIINFLYADSYQGTGIKMSNGEVLSVSRSREKKIQEMFRRFGIIWSK